MTAPIKYSQHRDNHCRAYVLIVVCWATSIAIGGLEQTARNGSEWQMRRKLLDGGSFLCCCYLLGAFNGLGQIHFRSQL